MPDIDLRALILVLAIVLDWLIGDPKRLYRYISHPVQFMGELLMMIEGWLNVPGRPFRAQKVRGTIGFVLYLIVWVIVAIALTVIFDVIGVWGVACEIILACVLISGRSLYDHVRDVCDALKFKTDQEARQAVGQIVGRDTAALDAQGVARAAIESGAENLSDGFIGPVLFYLVGGLPGLFLYKATNTADSMIGYKTQRFLGYGWAAARFDDLLNWLPSRITGFMIVLFAFVFYGRGSQSHSVMRRDASKHSSPNAGWPEAAMAGALGIAVAGPRVYKDMMKQDPWINARGRLDVGSEDIWQALRIMQAVIMLSIPLVGVFCLFVFL